jgi:hydroxypyruvate isomerase
MTRMNRREALKSAAAAGAALTLARPALTAPTGRLNQSVCYWTYQKWYTLDELCKEAVRIGLKGIDLVNPDQFATVKKHGLTPVLAWGSGPNQINVGLNRAENHDAIVAALRTDITNAAAGGVPNVITFSGPRKGLPDNEGLENCVTALNSIKGVAEEKGVTVTLELLNSKVDHKGYMADHTAWGVEVIRRVNSPRVRLLFDIYHMQIMEGDLIRTITANFDFIAHFHTGGNPGRHEINGTQEINYRAVAKAIADKNFQGFVAHEFTPTADPPIRSLEEAYSICTV